MPTILADQSDYIAIQKASQMGLSTYCILWILYLCKTQKARRGTIYWLPTDSAVSDFVNTKLDPLIRDNSNDANLASNELKHAIYEYKKGANNQGLKFIYGTPTIWRGIKSKSGVKSISADAAVYDEFDEADQSQVAQARKRLSASEVKLERELSTPTIPDYGINKQIQETDHCHFAFKCEPCGHWNILEDEFPKCFEENREGKFVRVCTRCHRELPIHAGKWVQKNARSKLRGYQVSQLYSPYVSPDEIMLEYRTTDFPGHFSNHVLGKPYLSSTDRITKEMVLSLCDPMRTMSESSISPTAMGVDVGADLHIVILKGKPKEQTVWAGTIQSFEELHMIMLRYNVKSAVIDALPETRKVREFIKKHRNIAWMCFYVDSQKGSYKWDEEQQQVNVNRTESLDASGEPFFNKTMGLPQRSKILEDLAEHFENTVKVVDEDKDSGSRRYVYKKLGPDHFRHAHNYAKIALTKMRGEIISIFR